MHEKTLFLVIITIVIYAAILANGSLEVNIVTSAIAIPLLLIFGLILNFTKPKENPKSELGRAAGNISRWVGFTNQCDPERMLIWALRLERYDLKFAIVAMKANEDLVSNGGKPYQTIEDYKERYDDVLTQYKEGYDDVLAQLDNEYQKPNKSSNRPKYDPYKKLNEEGKKVLDKYRSVYRPSLYTQNEEDNHQRLALTEAALYNLDKEIARAKENFNACVQGKNINTKNN